MNLSPGSRGDGVCQLERRLKGLGLYTGAVDSVFGDSVTTAVKSFQSAHGLQPDGVVGPQTWAALFPPAPSALLSQPVAQRCLALTGSFETSKGPPDCYAGLAGDFDGQGISYGALQWNIGQGMLQPMFSEMVAAHDDIVHKIFHDDLATLTVTLALPRSQQLQWARSIQDAGHHVLAPWRGYFQALGLTPEFQAIQLNHAAAIHRDAVALCGQYRVRTERGLALLFDVCVQNGSIRPGADAKIRADFAVIPGGDPLAAEVARLQSIANRVAEAARDAYIEDVRTRKLTIANGQGTVHGVTYNLEQQFGIRLQPFTSSTDG